MKRLPSTLIKKPLILGLIAFALNIFVSFIPVVIMHEKHIEHYTTLFTPSEFSNHKWMVEQNELITQALIFSLTIAFIIACIITLLAYLLKKSYVEVENFSHFDGLTGLYNRLMFMTIFEKEILKVTRNHSHLFLVILDIDDFKPINDTYGHLVGDEAIKLTAKTIQSLLRSSDIIGRFGGDEFILGIVDQNPEAASRIVSRILEEFNHKSLPVSKNNDSHDLQINLSIGYTAYKLNDDFKTMLQRSDQGLYISKEAGKNTATFIA